MIVKTFYSAISFQDLADQVNEFLTTENISFENYRTDWEEYKMLPRPYLASQVTPLPQPERKSGWYATISSISTESFENTLQSGLQFSL